MMNVFLLNFKSLSSLDELSLLDLLNIRKLLYHDCLIYVIIMEQSVRDISLTYSCKAWKKFLTFSQLFNDHLLVVVILYLAISTQHWRQKCFVF